MLMSDFSGLSLVRWILMNGMPWFECYSCGVARPCALRWRNCFLVGWNGGQDAAICFDMLRCFGMLPYGGFWNWGSPRHHRFHPYGRRLDDDILGTPTLQDSSMIEVIIEMQPISAMCFFILVTLVFLSTAIHASVQSLQRGPGTSSDSTTLISDGRSTLSMLEQNYKLLCGSRVWRLQSAVVGSDIWRFPEMWVLLNHPC